ncbi:MAG: 30S ribosomal protein S5 [Chloroflexi bacterium]|mgnify:CR=1 FL=1|nr:30S ribosomal protein S5 [Chloroflexota bacterium]|tara:strand:- start:2110 stop:2838 length:729 start_codon:yes stop_codon:yes gene_type:complete
MPEEIDKLNNLPEEENVTSKEVTKPISRKVESSNQEQKTTKKILEVKDTKSNIDQSKEINEANTSKVDHPRSRNRRRNNEEDNDLIERVVKIRRVSKVVKGGRNLSFNAMVVVGDGNGNVGADLGSASTVPDAIRKATTNAKKTMKHVKLNGETLFHEANEKFSGAKVLLKPAAPGTGVIAGGGVRAVMEAVGVKDVLSKTFGSSNTINIVRCTLKALYDMRDPQEEFVRRREINITTINEG